METDPQHSGEVEDLNLRDQVGGLYVGAQVVGVVGLVGAVILGYFTNDDFRRFFYSYLVGYMFFLAIALGGLFFVMLQHATKAGWSVTVRRIAEWFASSLPLMAVLSVPILAAVIVGHGSLYPWAVKDWGVDKGFKGWWLQRGFFVGRAVVYFVIWSWLGTWYWKQSVKQDRTGDIELTRRMQWWAPLGLVLFGLTLTFAAWDWIMSLDPLWYSTIFGVYYFAGCAVAVFSSLILTVRLLQDKGLLSKSVTTEHFHDLGKFLFGFTFFWGYIAFSQFMLQWYGNIPDETAWFRRHGASTASPNEFTPVVIALLVGHFLLPFPGLLSRHVKRSPAALTFWAVWMLAFCWVDVFWLIMPQFDAGLNNLDGVFHAGLIDLAVFVGIGGIFMAFVVRRAVHDSVRPIRDPRLPDSLAFENF
ncbi:MAG: quinol:cytochrome C oxidoreductase [Tepidisphaeraceae bacterium]